MPRFIDITSRRFSRLVATTPAHVRNGKWYWRCQCDCGQVVIVRNNNLRSGETTSCGCWKRELQYVHGAAVRGKKTPEYHSWSGMLARCCNPNTKDFKYYGALGITVCERWRGKNGFVNFLADMGKRPKGKSLDRIDPYGNYEPGNCQWATAKEQRANQRSAA